mmetsp:Transcript_20354/g.17657  ORF Transcript_20354/g.17657 Transcript_20354/m.17657 type:complete len:104 (+) Transcript_20354:550-861(+)
MSYDTERQVLTTGKVSQISTFFVDALTKISLELIGKNEGDSTNTFVGPTIELITTLNHPTWIKNKKQWGAVQPAYGSTYTILEVGDILVYNGEQEAKVVKIEN